MSARALLIFRYASDVASPCQASGADEHKGRDGREGGAEDDESDADDFSGSEEDLDV